MRWSHIIWDPTPGGNVEHIEQHDLTTHDVDHVLLNHSATGYSKSTDRPCVFGFTLDDRFIIVIYEEVDEETIIPITAYDVAES